MKKILGIISLMLVCVIMFGCNGNNNAKVKLASQKLSTGLDKMIVEIKKLDNFDNEKMQVDGYDEFYDYYDSMEDDEVNNMGRYYTPTHNRTAMKFAVPTKNNFSRAANLSATARNNRRKSNFRFTSKNNEETYNNLYTICGDCCELNDEYATCKKNLLNNCYDAKNLLNRLKNGEAKVSDEDLKTLNSYYEVLKQCLSNLQNCKSCSKNVKTINKKKTNLASNCGSMNADYLQIYNTLDSNCCSCNNANSSVIDLMQFVNKLLGLNNKESVSNSTRNVNNSRRYVRNSRSNRYKNSYTQNNYQEPVDSRTLDYVQENNSLVSNENTSRGYRYVNPRKTYTSDNYCEDCPNCKDCKNNDLKNYNNQNSAQNESISNSSENNSMVNNYHRPIRSSQTETNLSNNKSNQNITRFHLSKNLNLVGRKDVRANITGNFAA